ncbi:unnamed protein product [Gordionus sp. m RMFG-2023]
MALISIILQNSTSRDNSPCESLRTGKCSLYFLELKDSFNPGEMWKSPHDICMECSCTAEDGFMQTDCKDCEFLLAPCINTDNRTLYPDCCSKTCESDKSLNILD